MNDRQLFTSELTSAFPAPSAIFDEVYACLEEIEEVAHGECGSSFILINHLLASVPGLATELLVRNNEGQAGRLERFVGAALSAVVETADPNLLSGYIVRSTASTKVLAQLAEAYARFEPSRPYTPEELELFKRTFASKDPTVLMVASSLVRQVGRRSPALAVELICLTDFEVNARAIHDMFIVLKELDDYWVHAFLVASIQEDPGLVV